jgi:hypothetical protein
MTTVAPFVWVVLRKRLDLLEKPDLVALNHRLKQRLAEDRAFQTRDSVVLSLTVFFGAMGLFLLRYGFYNIYEAIYGDGALGQWGIIGAFLAPPGGLFCAWLIFKMLVFPHELRWRFNFYAASRRKRRNLRTISPNRPLLSGFAALKTAIDEIPAKYSGRYRR